MCSFFRKDTRTTHIFPHICSHRHFARTYAQQLHTTHEHKLRTERIKNKSTKLNKEQQIEELLIGIILTQVYQQILRFILQLFQHSAYSPWALLNSTTKRGELPSTPAAAPFRPRRCYQPVWWAAPSTPRKNSNSTLLNSTASRQRLHIHHPSIRSRMSITQLRTA